MNIQKFLDEDRAQQDVTTQAIVQFLGKDPELTFDLLAKEAGIFSGTRWLQEFAKANLVTFGRIAEEGAPFASGAVVAAGHGSASRILSTERTLLNGLQFLCGVATLSGRYVERVKEISAKKNMPAPAVLHTRKILPGLRDFVADALSAGGAGRHRFTLADRMLFKDNHFQLLKTEANLRAFLRSLTGEQLGSALFEADTEAQVQILIEGGVRNLMLDNFSRARLEKVLPQLPKNVVVEVSGGIRFETLEDFVLPGVHRISIGAMTHAARSLDISLEARESAVSK